MEKENYGGNRLTLVHRKMAIKRKLCERVRACPHTNKPTKRPTESHIPYQGK